MNSMHESVINIFIRGIRGSILFLVGLDRETNKELLLKHMREKGPEGAPLRELQQVLPGHNRSQIQVLLRELRNENRAYFRGNTSAAKWFAGPSPAENS